MSLPISSESVVVSCAVAASTRLALSLWLSLLLLNWADYPDSWSDVVAWLLLLPLGGLPRGHSGSCLNLMSQPSCCWCPLVASWGPLGQLCCGGGGCGSVVDWVEVDTGDDQLALAVDLPREVVGEISLLLLGIAATTAAATTTNYYYYYWCWCFCCLRCTAAMHDVEPKNNLKLNWCRCPVVPPSVASLGATRALFWAELILPLMLMPSCRDVWLSLHWFWCRCPVVIVVTLNLSSAIMLNSRCLY